SGGGTAGRGGAGLGGIVPLFGPETSLEPAVVVETADALKTYWADRGRDRHAREARFNAYEHYLHLYWEKRTAAVEIIDTVGKDQDGGSVTFNVKSQWKLDTNQAELRFFFRGIGTVAEYHDNKSMTMVGGVDDFTYTRTVTHKMPEGRKLQVGDKMEFELSQFLDKNYKAAEFTGRDNYYGTTMLYIAGKGLVPWAQTGAVCQNQDEPVCRDSEPIPEEAWLGGHTTMHEVASGEPESAFMQMAANLAPDNGQLFVLGRRAIHTSFDDGHHDESDENPRWTEQASKLGPLFINHSCNQCHAQNARALPPAVGAPLKTYVFKVGTETGAADPTLGEVLQPSDGTGEPAVSISAWIEEGGLRKPTFAFTGGAAPSHYSPRISPQIVGMGLLEAIPESQILELADENDDSGDGVSGRARLLQDPESGVLRLGRFGWKAGQATVEHQVAGALKTDLGVLTSVFDTPDCGPAQPSCGPAGMELGDEELAQATAYISLLAVRAQRNWASPEVVRGKELFMEAGCASCHTPTFRTSELAVHAELRGQTIHPYTDLLLHDMGAGLADTLPEGTLAEGGNASNLEWRTPPLWGIGFTADTAGGEAYLHDGRARTLTEAILWHGGEGDASRKAFSALSDGDATALLAFLKSL
ncbi:MAG: c-type cytochrome, partial [Myxococcales bacterium]